MQQSRGQLALTFETPSVSRTAQVLELLAQEKPAKDIAQLIGVSISYVYRCKRGGVGVRTGRSRGIDRRVLLARALGYRRLPDTVEYLSIIKMNDCARLKIGVARNPYDRLRDLQTGNPELLHLLRTVPFPNAYGMERRLHTRYAMYKQAGEWFELPPEMLGQLLLESVM